jgi:diguanylate cyclase (GGDEF)-like protein
MKWLIPILTAVAGYAAGASAAPIPLATLHAVHALTNQEASRALPVAFEATVTYYRDTDFDLFVQEGDEAVYVYYKQFAGLVPGDRVLVRGQTQDSFRPVVISGSVSLLHHGDPPTPRFAGFGQLIRAELVCRRVTVRAVVHSADLVWTDNGQREIYLQVVMDGGYVDVAVNSDDARALKRILDATVDVTGVVAEKFDGKKQQVGIAIWVQSLADLKIVKPAGSESLPVTPMDQVLSTYFVKNLTGRVRVHGTITYYQPGSAITLQSGPKSLWISTLNDTPMHVGDVADVTGFPDVRNGFLTLTDSEIQDLQVQAPIAPQPVTWRELGAGSNAFDLVSVEGRLLMEVREAQQDQYILVSGGHVFSAIYRHPNPASPDALPEMEWIPIGSVIRVTGISMYSSSDPFNGPLASHILLRSFGDIAVVGTPGWLDVGHLVIVVVLLLVGILAVGVWGWFVERKLRRQTGSLAYVEHRRSRILEAMNASRPLAETLDEITELVSLKLNGAPCWCETADGTKVGNRPSATSSSTLSIVEHAIAAPGGPVLGTIYASICARTQFRAAALEALSMASGLAALAIENARLHADLVHRSEFDLLTDIENRFSLERNLDARIQAARQAGGIFGLIYIDLDCFKQVNDRYGHQVGDAYLQHVAERMKKQLRQGDTLARLGGDEFAALISNVLTRVDLEEIALGLEHCFQAPFTLEGNRIRGSASIGAALYPEDATTKDGLLNAADAAMYAVKNGGRNAPAAAGEPDREAVTG